MKVLKEMAYTRSDAIDRCASLGSKFIEHFIKCQTEKDLGTIGHHLSEMDAWWESVKSIRLKPSTKPLSPTQLVDWFFTAGSSVEDMLPDKLQDEYEKYIVILLSSPNQTAKGAYTALFI